MKTNTNRELLLMHKFTEEWSTNFSSQVSRIMNIVDQQDTLDGIIPIIEVANVYNQRFAHARTDKENLLKNRKARPFEFLIHKNWSGQTGKVFISLSKSLSFYASYECVLS